MNRPSVLDVFSGIGGLSLGFENAGYDCVAGVELNDQHREVFSQIHPAANVDFADATRASGWDLLNSVGLRPGDLDVLVGGPPCQAFSQAGKRQGEGDERGKLIHHFVRLVSELAPKAFVMENVVGLQSIHGGRLLDEVVANLTAFGYTISPVTKLNAADYGVPQIRRRIFLVGLRGARRAFEFSRPTHWSDAGERLALDSYNGLRAKPYVTVSDAIGDLPCNGRLREFPDDSDVEDDVRIPYVSAAETSYQRSMRGRKNSVSGNQTSRHFPHIIEALRKLAPGQEEPRTRYRRLYGDRPAFTLRAGSGTFTALRPIHPKRHRVITVREAARLQSFPDWVEFSVTKKWAYQSIGNSVPPQLAESIARRLLDFLT